MSRKVQFIILAILLVMLVLVWAGNVGGPSGLGGILGPERVERFIVPNPSLRLDLLAEISKLDYAGMQRNIFNATPLPPPEDKRPTPPPVVEQGPPQPTQPVPDAPMVPPFKFYGYVVDSRSGHRRGFFTNGDDIWVVSVGETVQRRFKVLSLNNTRAEVEETASGKRATLQLDETAAPSGGN